MCIYIYIDNNGPLWLVRVSKKSILQECRKGQGPKTVSCKIVPKSGYESVPQKCLTRRYRKSVPQEGLARKGVLQECPTRLSFKSVFQRVSGKSAPLKRIMRGCLTLQVVFLHEYLTLQERPVSQHDSDQQECPTGVFLKIRQERLMTVSHHSASHLSCSEFRTFKNHSDDHTRISYIYIYIYIPRFPIFLVFAQ